MRTLRGSTIVESGCSDPDRNIFYSKSSDGRTYVMRQPRRRDSGEQRKAWKKVSPAGRSRYIRHNIHIDLAEQLYNMNPRCRIPLYRGESPGVLPLTVELEGKTVGFCDMFFNDGEYFSRFQVSPEDKCANGSIVALDHLRGLGIGTYYSATSNAIAKHFDCQWILGRTLNKGGMRQIRIKDGWEAIATDGTWIDHRKRL